MNETNHQFLLDIRMTFRGALGMLSYFNANDFSHSDDDTDYLPCAASILDFCTSLLTADDPAHYFNESMLHHLREYATDDDLRTLLLNDPDDESPFDLMPIDFTAPLFTETYLNRSILLDLLSNK